MNKRSLMWFKYNLTVRMKNMFKFLPYREIGKYSSKIIVYTYYMLSMLSLWTKFTHWNLDISSIYKIYLCGRKFLLIVYWVNIAHGRLPDMTVLPYINWKFCHYIDLQKAKRKLIYNYIDWKKEGVNPKALHLVKLAKFKRAVCVLLCFWGYEYIIFHYHFILISLNNRIIR